MLAEPPSRIRWLLAASVAVIGAVSYLDRVNLSIAAKSIAGEFHLDDTQLGWIFSAFSIGYALFQVGGGRLADRYGPRRILALGAVWWAAFTALTAVVPSFIAGAVFVFFAVRLLLGIGESVMYPGSNRWVASWIPAGERGLANGILFSGVGGGAALTPPLITALMTRYGWRASFWVCAVAGLLVGGAWYALARDRPEQHSWLDDAERKVICEGILAENRAEGPRLPWAAILGSGEVWLITFSYFCYGYVAYIFFSWFFIYLTAVRGMNLKAGSFYAALPFVAMAVCSALGGWIADGVCRRWGRRAGRCGTALLAMTTAAIFVLLGARVQSAAAASVILAGGAGALYVSLSSFWALSADLGGRSSGAVSGFMNMGGQLGSAITAVTTPVIAHRLGWTASFIVAGTLCLFGALAWLLVNPDRKLLAEQPARPVSP